jgi:pimeloyl-ACP methyl ester carboxylesterase
MTATVVGVHGIGNHQRATTPDEAAAILGNRWTAALRRGLGQDRGVAAVVAYYADHLAAEPAQGAADPEQLTEAEQAMLLEWAAALGAPPEVAQGQLAAPARAAADWIARRFGLDSALVRLLVTRFCREVHCYLSDLARRNAVRATVADTIAVAAPAVVIAHSLGSVVTYETLWAHPKLHVDLLITLGSPLAMPDVIFDKLHPAPEHSKGQRPPGVRRWINIADPGDVIAIPRRLTRFFDGINADLTTPIGVFNFHKVTGYLSCTTTSAALATLLGR